MPGRLLSPLDVRVWAAAFILVAILLVLTKFTSTDPDSALHAALSARLADGPVRGWIAPQWWGEWGHTDLYREHPIGIFLPPVILGTLGIPAAQAAYIAGVAASLAALMLIAHLVGGLTSREDGRAVLFLLLVMPVAFVFRIRANHEYPMLVCFLLVLIGLDGVRRAWGYAALVAAALTAALLIKGAFVVLIVAAAALWMALNPARASGPVWRPVAAVLLACGVMAVVAAVYDWWYWQVTGEAFWAHYWNKQLAPLELATPTEQASTLARHLAFYLSRLLWHPAPWSVALIIAIGRNVGGLRDWWRRSPDPARRGLLFAVAFGALALAMLSPSSRFAERYAFPAVFAIGTAGAVVAYRMWPAVRRAVTRLDAAIPAAPAVVWLALILLRLGLGPLLPRW
jgi:4-amino-4-deoxy-L-arabinose transferase-like glycosyltransferase